MSYVIFFGTVIKHLLSFINTLSTTIYALFRNENQPEVNYLPTDRGNGVASVEPSPEVEVDESLPPPPSLEDSSVSSLLGNIKQSIAYHWPQIAVLGAAVIFGAGVAIKQKYYI